MALFLPSFTEKQHAARGLNAARRILRQAQLPIGVGVNTGQAFTGFLGPTAEVAAFSAVGDAVNVAHRLGEAAEAGELLVAGDDLSESGPAAPEDGHRWEMREMQVKGRDQSVHAWSHKHVAEPAVA